MSGTGTTLSGTPDAPSRPERLLVCGCGAPLIATFHWRGMEWICIECGGLYEFFGPSSVNTTDKRWERYLALLAEWKEHAGAKLLTPGGRREGCEKCWGNGSEDHDKHATVEERAAHEQAMAWLLTRTGRASNRGSRPANKDGA